ncbi:hypothetical protein GCM10018771_20380 [Streptomyces cellulosae]|nr:hypothetical protein GCM10018771_20380 [Streptomyces cellulosae]
MTDRTRQILAERYGDTHPTMQVEPVEHPNSRQVSGLMAGGAANSAVRGPQALPQCGKAGQWSATRRR